MKYYDDEFLKQLNKVKLRTQYVKIILLTFQEEIIKEIQGKITNGNISVNGSSAIRRTLSLSMVVDENSAQITNIDNEISINKKFRLEVGLKNPFPNYIDQYGEIIWFPQGVYVISSANSSRSTSGWNVSITAKDKMCLLDGSAGGTFPAAAVLNERYVYLNDGSVKVEYPVLRQIIQEAVNHYGGESSNNIIINDLQDQVKMLVKYTGFNNIYYVTNSKDGQKNGNYSFIKPSGTNYKVITTNTDVGYMLTDFTYPGELTVNAGDSITSVLDKIVKILGNYEYFYDIEGHFIFQEIKNYVNKQSPLNQLADDTDAYLTEIAATDYTRKYSTHEPFFSLADLDSTATLSLTPKYDNIKNDFHVWGQKSENHLVHYHLAIDSKPEPDLAMQYMWSVYDKENQLIDYLFTETNTAPQCLILYPGEKYYTGREDDPTVYEVTKTACYKILGSTNNYYQILTPEYTSNRLPRVLKEGHTPYQFTEFFPPCKDYEWREELYRQALYLLITVGYDTQNTSYYQELIANWRDLYDPSKEDWNFGWNPDVKDHPDKLNYWLDIIDSGSDLGKYSINQIGCRTKAVNNNEIKTIYNKEVPDLLFIKAEDRNADINQEICQLPDSKWSLFSISSTGASCFDEIRDMLYQYLNYHTTVSITCIPVYYLEPNNILYIEDAKSGIIGNYQITQFSLPLGYNGTMSITATEIFQRV